MKKEIRKYIKKDIVRIKTNDVVENKEIKDKDMPTKEELKKALENAEKNFSNTSNVKIVKKDKGLIERTNSSKVVLTEDNRQVLGD